MPLPREDWQEESLEPGSQYLPPGSDPQAAPRVMAEEPVSAQGIGAISDTQIPSTRKVHSNSVQNPTEINLDAATLASSSGEEHNVPSQSSHLIP